MMPRPSRLPRPALAALLALLASAELRAQTTASAASAGGGAAPTHAETGAACRSDGSPEPLGTTIPLAVLDHLEGIAASPFVHAFLLHHLAEYGNGNHWLVKCAVAFRNTPLERLQELAARQVEPGVIIKELRVAVLASEEERRVRTATSVTLDTVVQELRFESTTPKLQAFGPILLRTHRRFCEFGPAAVCAKLAAAVTGTDTLLARRDRLSTAMATLSGVERELVRLTDELNAVATAQARDSASLVEQSKPAPTPAAGDSLALSAVVAQRATVRDSLVKVRDSVRVQRDSAASRVSQATADADIAERGLQDALRTLSQELEARPRSIGGGLAVVPERQPVRVAVTTPEVVQPVAGMQAAGPGPASVALALTDFVIDRTKQELVLGYLRTAYVKMRADSLLQAAFPETFALLQSLASARDPHEISIAAAGRVPLGVWRTTLATDFTRLPVQLFRADASRICTRDPGCIRRVRRLQPLAISAQRLIAGDPVFDVLREAPLDAGAVWVDATPELRRVLQGLTLVAGVAESYLVQGLVPAADPARHPYILSARALAQVPSGQREVFARLLLARAAPMGPAVRDTLRLAPLLDLVGRAARVAEQIAVALPNAEPSSAGATMLVRQALATVVTATDVAFLLSDSSAARVDTLRQHWKNYATIIDPLVARNYGLALSRSTMLLQTVTGDRPDGMLLTLTTLGAGLAEAQNGGDVRAAFEAAASPVGGWQAKRLRESSRVSVTAFPGVAAGTEWLLEGDRKGETATAVGASLPVGVEIQLLRRRAEVSGVMHCRLFICSVGVFVPVMDLGALMSYRLDDDPAVQSEPNTTLRQVFAPGAYLSFGVGRSPFALLVGGQFMPSLREVTDGASGTAGHAARFGAALAVDVVLLTR